MSKNGHPVFTYKENGTSIKLISYCGLFCGACRKYMQKKCPGCDENKKFCWCEARECCMENNYRSCADCKKYRDISDCKKLNNFFSNAVEFILGVDRITCLKRIKEVGHNAFAREMAEKGLQSVRK
jgi:hypothetical protein